MLLDFHRAPSLSLVIKNGGGDGGGVWCGGGGGADRCEKHACLSIRANAHANELKRTGDRAPAPSAGLSSRHPYACASESRFQAFPVQNLTQPQVEEKDCKARRQSFPSPRSWMPWIRSDMRRCTWTCLPGKPDPFSRVTSSIYEMTRSNKLPFTTTALPTLGKDQGGNRMVKTSV